MDMRAGADRLLAHVVQVFGAAQAHHGYLFANARATRIKLLVHDGFGVWCAARRLNTGSFVWPRADALATARLCCTNPPTPAGRLVAWVKTRRIQAKYRTTNWAQYNAALKARGSLKVLLERDMQWLATLACQRGRSQTFSDSAIPFCLSSKCLFGQPLCQSLGMVQSLLQLAQLD